jgi:hypothetical protein
MELLRDVNLFSRDLKWGKIAEKNKIKTEGSKMG